MIANINRNAMAQAAMSFIAVNNLIVAAKRRGESEEYVRGLFNACAYMQDEFLRWIGNATQVHSVSKLNNEHALAIAQVVYTCVTKLDIEVK